MSLDETLRRADPLRDEPLEFDDAFDALREGIAARPLVARRRLAPRRRWLVPPAVAALACVAAFVVFFTPPGDGGTERAWAAPLVKVAESVPRLLVGDWTVTRADQFAVGEGEMEFGDGARHVQLNWRGADFAEWVEGRAHSTRELAPVQVQGTSARLFEYAPGDVTALWRQGGYTMELRGNAVPEALAALRAVSVDEWLGAMPASVVKPDQSDEVIDEMLVDLPLPPGFDRARLDTEGMPRDRYQLGARVAGAVACGWIKTWIEAEGKPRSEAVAALQTARNWTILKELSTQGGYSEVLWHYADSVAADGKVIGGKELTVQESYEDALGC